MSTGNPPVGRRKSARNARLILLRAGLARCGAHIRHQRVRCRRPAFLRRGSMIGAKQRAPRSEGAHPSSHREPDSASPRGSVGDARTQRGHAVQYRGGSGDERAGWTPWRVGDVGPGPTRTGIGVKTASGAQVLERCRFRNACGRPRSDGCRSVRARPESERRQWVGWTIGPPSVALSTYRASRRSLSIHFGLIRAPLHRRHREARGASMCY